MLSDFVPQPASGAETPNSPEFKTHLDTFLSYLTFWQDVLEHCRSAEVKQTLLDHFQVLFLQQLLLVPQSSPFHNCPDTSRDETGILHCSNPRMQTADPL